MVARIVKSQPFTVMLAILLGLVAAPVLALSMQRIANLYDEAFPVVVARGELVSAGHAEVVVRISGEKRRNCTYLRLQAITRDAKGDMSDANIQRIDMPENGDTKPRGSYYMGEWRIWPRGNAVAIAINANHLCGERQVVTQLTELCLIADHDRKGTKC